MYQPDVGAQGIGKVEAIFRGVRGISAVINAYQDFLYHHYKMLGYKCITIGRGYALPGLTIQYPLLPLNMNFTPEIEERLALLQEKYEGMGQEMQSYLDGLLHADCLSYWDYIHLDTLLSLQSPKTPFPDEEIFIIYHQITELYFKLALHECRQIAEAQPLTVDFFTA